MPIFAVVVLILAFVALVAMFVVRSRKVETNPRRRSKQRAKRETAEALVGPGSTAPVDVSDDAPRMPMGDLPPRPSRRRGH